MSEPLLDNLRSFAAKVATVLDRTAVARADLTGFVSSEFDPFLNQLTATGPIVPRDAAAALEGRPGFVWLTEEAAASGTPGAGSPSSIELDEPMRGRGLASALVHACHAAARAKGIDLAVLQATPAGRPVYARAGYREERTLPVLRFA